MPIDISTRFSFSNADPIDMLLQFEAAALPEQQVLSANTSLPQVEHMARVPAKDSVGERIWLRATGECQIEYSARVDVQRQTVPVEELEALDPHDLPGEAAEYLFDSRYCQADRLQSFVHDNFGMLRGGPRIAAMRDWIADHFTYMPGASNQYTTALDSFVERHGICRDYAHVMICFARASTIPARYVSCYAPGVTPPDFHAVAEVFLRDPENELGGTWQIVDATNMADPTQTAKIGIGRDAADVSFMTTFGHTHFNGHEVTVTQAD